MTTSALPSELDDDAHSHSGRHQLQKEHSGDLEAHFLHVRAQLLPSDVSTFPIFRTVTWQLVKTMILAQSRKGQELVSVHCQDTSPQWIHLTL